MNTSDGDSAILYRMVTDEHICPFGVKSLALLKSKGFRVDDHPLTSRAATDAFKAEYNVKTTPQTFIGGKRIGGYDDLRRYFGQPVPAPDAVSYGPVIALFAMAALIALSLRLSGGVPIFVPDTLRSGIAVAMCLLALLKLRDIESFSNVFIGYDLLAQRWPRYAYIYPFAEAAAGILMISGLLIWLAAPIALFIGSIGAASVVKAVYLDGRHLKCACVGGQSKVPLGFISLTENTMMVGMGIWMLVSQP